MHIDDHWVHHPRGRLFARSWTPAAADTNAAPLVLLHESLGCVALWRDFPRALAEATGRRVVAYDRLGFGQSDPRDGAMPLDFIADEARHVFPAMLDQLGIDRCALFGHSVGGGMAVHCAAEWPDRCATLITESAQAFVEDRTVQGLHAAQALFTQPAQMARLARYHGDKAPWVLAAWLDTWLSPAFASWTLAEVLPRVTCPVLALHGTDDQYGSLAHPEQIAASVRGPARLTVMPLTGHVPHREHTAHVAATVAAWLREWPPG